LIKGIKRFFSTATGIIAENFLDYAVTTTLEYQMVLILISTLLEPVEISFCHQ
jgi:hypothetical protein